MVKNRILFGVSIGLKIMFIRVSVIIKPCHSLLAVRYRELFERISGITWNDKTNINNS